VLLGSAVACVVFVGCLPQVHEAGLQRARLAADKSGQTLEQLQQGVLLISLAVPCFVGCLLQVHEAGLQRARLAADKAAADDKVAAAAARLPEVEAEKKVAAAKKVRTWCIYVRNIVGHCSDNITSMGRAAAAAACSGSREDSSSSKEGTQVVSIC
jgi:hypothetical protein